MSISVLIVDDHAVLGKGLSMLLNSQDDMQVCGQANTASEAIEICGKVCPDVVLLDLSLPDKPGHAIIEDIKSQCNTKVLALTMHEDEAYFRRVIEAGGDGYILKKAADNELLSAIRAIHQGEMVVDQAFTKTLINHYRGQSKTNNRTGNQALSKREQEVLKLIVHGHTNREVGDQLYISIKTVETHIARIKEKLGFNRRSELVKYAIRSGYISPDNPDDMS